MLRLVFLLCCLVGAINAVQETALARQVAQLRQQMQLLQQELDHRRLDVRLKEAADHEKASTGGHEGHDHGASGGEHAGHDHEGAKDDAASAHAGHGTTGGGHSQTFFSGKDGVVILFSGWSDLNWTEYIFSCIAVVFLGILVEGLTTFRLVYPTKCLQEGPAAAFSEMMSPSKESNLVDEVDGAQSSSQMKQATKKPLNWTVHIIKTVLYFVTITLSYSLMLIVMSMNVGLFFSAIIGLSMGYFLFGAARAHYIDNDSAESCHNFV